MKRKRMLRILKNADRHIEWLKGHMLALTAVAIGCLLAIHVMN